jgi:hypothetical protein
VLGGAVCPGLLLCVPGILLVVVPLVALALLGLVLGALVMTPYLLIHAVIALMRAPRGRASGHGA